MIQYTTTPVLLLPATCDSSRTTYQRFASQQYKAPKPTRNEYSAAAIQDIVRYRSPFAAQLAEIRKQINTTKGA